MKRITTATLMAVVGLAATAGAGRADFGQTPPPSAPPATGAGGGSAGCASCGNPDEVYGVHPFLRKLTFWRKDAGAARVRSGGAGGGGGGAPLPPGYGTPGGPGGPQVGTLVFPQNPYIRSPRDYFMYEPGR